MLLLDLRLTDFCFLIFFLAFDFISKSFNSSFLFFSSLQLKNGQKILFPLPLFSLLQRTIEVLIMKTNFVNNDSQTAKVFQIFCFYAKNFQKN
jgi:hypothetical protein